MLASARALSRHVLSASWRHKARPRALATAEVAPAGGRQTDLSGLGPKRFYKDVDVSLDPSTNAYCVTIDGRKLRTPQRSVLSAPTEPLATAVAAEWDAQGDRIRPSSMPLTTLVSTAHDIVPEYRGTIVPSVLNYLSTDALCIRPSLPQSLVEAQSKVLDPIATHLKEARGLELIVSIGGLTAKQPESVVEHVQHSVWAMDDFSLAAMNSATATCKSVAIAMALADGAITAEQAVQAARSEEAWQESVWGTVEGGHDLDAADIHVRLAAADLIFRLVELSPDSFLRVEFEAP